jgi:hypothetical protein
VATISNALSRANCFGQDRIGRRRQDNERRNRVSGRYEQTVGVLQGRS